MLHQILLMGSNQGGWDGQGMQHAWWEITIKFWLENMNGRDHTKDPGIILE
jgi:hypothetical protein